MSAPVQGGLTDERIKAIRSTINPSDGWDGDDWDYALSRAVEQHVIASQSAAPVAASDEAVQKWELTRYAYRKFGQMLANENGAWVTFENASTIIKYLQSASGSAQPASEQDAIRAAYTPPPRANLSKGNHVGQGLRLAEAIATQAATVTGAQAGAGRPQVVMLAGDTLELCVIDKDGLLKAIPGSHPIGMPWQWIAALHGYSAIKAMAPGAKP